VLLALALLAGLGYVFQKLRTCTKSLADNSLYIIGLSSIVSVILAISSITGVIFIENLFNQSYGYNQYTPLLFSLLGLVLVCAFLLAPPLYIGISRSPKLGFYTFLSQIVLLFIFGVIGIAILFTFFSSNRAIQQYQLPMSASNTVSPQGIGSVLPK
jgi:H+/Cl- antiporter ClcA